MRVDTNLLCFAGISLIMNEGDSCNHVGTVQRRQRFSHVIFLSGWLGVAGPRTTPTTTTVDVLLCLKWGSQGSGM